jgi:hypothetical protein
VDMIATALVWVVVCRERGGTRRKPRVKGLLFILRLQESGFGHCHVVCPTQDLMPMIHSESGYVNISSCQFQRPEAWIEKDDSS